MTFIIFGKYLAYYSTFRMQSALKSKFYLFKMKRLTHILFFFLITIVSCHKIETGSALDKKTIEHIKSLGLLDEDETIIKYYCNFQENKAGNFFTNKRIAHYWLDDNDQSKNDTSFAWYEDIIAIDTVYKMPDTFIPYMKITKTDATEFNVFVEGKHENIKAFFEEAMKLWKSKKKNSVD